MSDERPNDQAVNVALKVLELVSESTYGSKEAKARAVALHVCCVAMGYPDALTVKQVADGREGDAAKPSLPAGFGGFGAGPMPAKD